jgi:hypothetical protein
MAVIVRRNKPEAPAPIVIKRAKRPRREDLHGEQREGQGWVYGRGLPPDRTKRAYHLINVYGVDYAFLWEPHGRLGEEWTAGKWSCSPGVMGCHDYRGECTIVYRSSSTPTDDFRYQRKVRSK